MMSHLAFCVVEGRERVMSRYGEARARPAQGGEGSVRVSLLQGMVIVMFCRLTSRRRRRREAAMPPPLESPASTILSAGTRV